MKHFSVQKKAGTLLSSLLIAGLALTPMVAFASDGCVDPETNKPQGIVNVPQDLVKNQPVVSSDLDPNIQQIVDRDEFKIQGAESYTRLFVPRRIVDREGNGFKWQGPFSYIFEDKKQVDKSWLSEKYEMKFGDTYGYQSYVSQDFLEGLLKGAPKGVTIREYLTSKIGVKIPSHAMYLVGTFIGTQEVCKLTRDTLQIDAKYIAIDKEYDGKWCSGTIFKADVATDFGLDSGRYNEAAFEKLRTGSTYSIPSSSLFAIMSCPKCMLYDD